MSAFTTRCFRYPTGANRAEGPDTDAPGPFGVSGRLEHPRVPPGDRDQRRRTYQSRPPGAKLSRCGPWNPRRQTALIVFGVAGAVLLALWLFEVTRHFLFLVVLAWLFAIALEPGIRAHRPWTLPRLCDRNHGRRNTSSLSLTPGQIAAR